MRKILTALMPVAAMAAMFAGFTPSAHASSDNCLNSGGFCAGETVNLPGHMSLAALQTPVVGVKVGVQYNSTSPVQDWYIHNPANPVNNSKTFELAPNGARSGLCMSQPVPNAGTKLVLRKCRQNGFQTFTAVDDGNGFFGWVNTASGDVFTVPDGGKNGTALVSRNPGKLTFKGGQWAFDDQPSLTLDAAISHPVPHATVRPAVTPQHIADFKGNGDCMQASGSGQAVTVPNCTSPISPNQNFGFTTDTSQCANGITTAGCPFPGVTTGQQIAKIAGRSAGNSGLCMSATHVNVSTNLLPCNGSSGVDWVLDGFSLENAFLGRQQGGKTYACSTSGSGLLEVFVTFTSNFCQWAQ